MMKFRFYFTIACLISVVGQAASDGAGSLKWNSADFTQIAKPGEIAAHLSLNVQNVSERDVTIQEIKPSCGCTVVKMPAQPWRIPAHAKDHLELLIDLRGKHGALFKQLTIISREAPDVLNFTVEIPEAGTNAMSAQAAMRVWGQELAATDHQAVFKQDCVKCHLVPAFGKSGEFLFHTACGICHEAERRATMVPDLAALKGPIPADYWKNWITYGKVGTLMPGFAATEGGPLDVAQIRSLVDYLTRAYPRPIEKATLEMK